MLIFVSNILEVYKHETQTLGRQSCSEAEQGRERTASGIFLTSSAQEKPEVYEVVEVGPGGMVDGNEVKMIVTPGQSVLVGKYSGSKVKLEDQEYTIVRQSDILAVIE